MKIFYTIILCLIALPALSFGQSFTIEGEFRPRSEFRDGFRKPLADSLSPGFITFQRTRLSVDYRTNSLNARVTLQDARIWGQDDTKGSTVRVGVFEAWVEMLIVPGLSAQFGRQGLSYDDQRLFSVGNWSNTGTVHDALFFKYRETGFQAHLGFAYNNTNDTLFAYPYAVKSMYQTMGLFWAGKQLSNGGTLSVLAVGEGLQKLTTPRPTLGRFTVGANLVYPTDSSNFGGMLTAYNQSGRDANFKILYAYLLAAKASYKTTPFTSSIGMDYYSGTAFDADTARKNFTFNKLYGLSHSFNGPMEYWATLPAGGLVDYYAGTMFKADPWWLSITGHVFNLAQTMKDKYKNLIGKNIGSEADLVLNYQWSKEVSFQGGWSMYFPTTATKQVNSMFNTQKNLIALKRPQWVYLMVSIKPVFFKNL